VARVRLAPGAGQITVNGRRIEEYFLLETQRMWATQPLTVTETATKFNARVLVNGGGPNGQAGAVRLGLARALLEVDVTYRPTLKSQGMLTRWQERGSSNPAEFFGPGRSIDAPYRGCATRFSGSEKCCLKTAFRKAGWI
jgi:small subunit ribosomal protein S9